MSITVQIKITEDRIAIPDLEAFLREAEGGAVNLFVGTTRRVTEDRITVELSYECARELALAELDRIVSEAKVKWPILRVVVVHRVGTVGAGEASVVIGVATAHRVESFEACRFLIDELKKRVPIWKKEVYEDGDTEWVTGNSPS
ncbi:MAG: molybdenum cofactor biosynthesis protein MoaE [Rhodothermia bacterium]|nr:MAG: molybdenum cofactor biosynthesis protein MoaE [Rhodothermia bacterium]